MKKEFKIGISVCLAGKNCRYDGRNKLNVQLKKFLEKHFEVISICPEVGCGMSVQREPANLIIKDAQRHFPNIITEDEKYLSINAGKIDFLNRVKKTEVKLYSLTTIASSHTSAESASAIEGYGAIPSLRFIHELPPSFQRNYGVTSTHVAFPRRRVKR